MNANTIKIQLFGPCTITIGSQKKIHFPSRKSKLLFIYLATYCKPVKRETLAQYLWPNVLEKIAGKRLRTELWRLKKCFHSFDLPNIFLFKHDEVMINDQFFHSIDQFRFLTTLNNVINSAPSSIDTAAYNQALSWFSSGIPIFSEGQNDDWAILQRQNIINRSLEAMERIFSHYFELKQWELAIKVGEQLLKYDPLLEHIHLRMMQGYFNYGQRTRAIQQYIICCRALKEDLGISPGEQMELAYRDIISRHHTPTSISHLDSEKHMKNELVQYALKSLAHTKAMILKLGNNVSG